MVRTGARANASDKPAAPRMESLSPGLAAESTRLYPTLGGRDPARHLRPSSWDLSFKGGMLVELDEQLHFNRYRATTLHDDWTELLPWRPDYLRYC